MPQILIIHGPNLNLLGVREPELYGSTNLNDINEGLLATAKKLELDTACFQSNHEGALIDRIHEAIQDKYRGIIINAGGLSHSSIALADALRGFKGYIIETHLTNVHSREAFRHHSYISEVANGVIVGLGARGYHYALMQMSEWIKSDH